ARINIEAAIGQLTFQNRDNRLIDQRARIRIPLAIDRRIEPKLEEYVIGFQRRVGSKFRAPVAITFLETSQVVRRLAHGSLSREFHRTADMGRRTHWIEIVNSAGRENRTSSSTNSISSSCWNPRSRRNSI